MRQTVGTSDFQCFFFCAQSNGEKESIRQHQKNAQKKMHWTVGTPDFQCFLLLGTLIFKVFLFTKTMYSAEDTLCRTA
jgi:hypothetical protein